jgi:hypothetical protein
MRANYGRVAQAFGAKYQEVVEGEDRRDTPPPRRRTPKRQATPTVVADQPVHAERPRLLQRSRCRGVTVRGGPTQWRRVGMLGHPSAPPAPPAGTPPAPDIPDIQTGAHRARAASWAPRPMTGSPGSGAPPGSGGRRVAPRCPPGGAGGPGRRGHVGHVGGRLPGTLGPAGGPESVRGPRPGSGAATGRGRGAGGNENGAGQRGDERVGRSLTARPGTAAIRAHAPLGSPRLAVQQPAPPTQRAQAARLAVHLSPANDHGALEGKAGVGHGVRVGAGKGNGWDGADQRARARSAPGLGLPPEGGIDGTQSLQRARPYEGGRAGRQGRPATRAGRQQGQGAGQGGKGAKRIGIRG